MNRIIKSFFALVIMLCCLKICGFSAILMKPYLQAVTKDSIYVLVECDSTSNVTIEYGLTTSYGNTATTTGTGNLISTTDKPSKVHKIKLSGLQPNTVIVIQENGQEKEIPFSQVIIGDKLLVKPGDKIPVDGEIISGSSFIDESTITGESVPVEKEKGGKVFAGTLNQKGSFVFVAQKVGGETILAQIIKMVQQAQGSKPPVQKLVDKIAGTLQPKPKMTGIAE